MPNPCAAAVAAWVRQFPRTHPSPDAPTPLAVAYSGGADSTALLLALHAQWPGPLVALHVNHGMQAAAATFEQHCRAFCADRGIPLHVAQRQVKPGKGESPEDAARKVRYASLALLCSEFAIKNAVLAQHADDQVETLMIALSRGAGIKGLSAMPARFVRHGIDFHRPVLAVQAQAIRDWLVESNTVFIEDPSNENLVFTRNQVRHKLLPVLQAVFPAFRDTVARSVRHAAQAQGLLDELAADDAKRVAIPPGIEALQALSVARQANLLRHWLQVYHAATPSEAQLLELIKQIAACTTRGHRLRLKVASGFVGRAGSHLQYFSIPLSL